MTFLFQNVVVFVFLCYYILYVLLIHKIGINLKINLHQCSSKPLMERVSLIFTMTQDMRMSEKKSKKMPPDIGGVKYFEKMNPLDEDRRKFGR